jgi:hypothetical protein
MFPVKESGPDRCVSGVAIYVKRHLRYFSDLHLFSQVMRPHEHKPMAVRGWITGLGQQLAPCVVEDISSEGAKLLIRSGQPPDMFKLYFSPYALTFRNCLVLWRRRECVGVQFSGAASAPE